MPTDMLQPYQHVHYESATGMIPVKPCRPYAIVVSNVPQRVTCPKCLEGLQRVVDFLDRLETMDLDTTTP